MNRIIVPSKERMDAICRWAIENYKFIIDNFMMPFDEGCLELKFPRIELYFKANDNIISLALKLKDSIGNFDFKLDTSTWKVAFSSLPIDLHDVEELRQTRDEFAAMFCGAMTLIVYHKDAVAESLIRTKEPAAPAKNNRHKSKGKSKPSKPQTQHIYVLQNFEPKEATKKLKAAKRKYTKPTTEVQVRGHYRTYPSGKRVWVKPFTKYNGKKSDRDKEYIL